MYDETNVPLPEYQVRPVTRYVLTRFTHPFIDIAGVEQPGQSSVIAEFGNGEGANDVADAMRKNDIALAALDPDRAA